MKRYGQLTADQQAWAQQAQLDALAVDDALLADLTTKAILDRLAGQRARDAFYLEEGDRIVQLPPAPA